MPDVILRNAVTVSHCSGIPVKCQIVVLLNAHACFIKIAEVIHCNRQPLLCGKLVIISCLFIVLLYPVSEIVKLSHQVLGSAILFINVVLQICKYALIILFIIKSHVVAKCNIIISIQAFFQLYSFFKIFNSFFVISLSFIPLKEIILTHPKN